MGLRTGGAIADSVWWDSHWETVQPFWDTNLPFRDLFSKYLVPGGTCFEVGCYPGRFLAYLCKNFDYEANGIDSSPYVSTRLPAFLHNLGVRVGEIIHGDFLTYSPRRTYDVVCSFGFLEHFEDYRRVIELHARLVKPGGTLLLTCPNMRGLQWFRTLMFKPDDLRHHVLGSMNLPKWELSLRRAGMRPVFHGYYQAGDFLATLWKQLTGGRHGSGLVARACRTLDNRVPIPNRLTAAHLVSVSRRDLI